jgi:hypothetical protein
MPEICGARHALCLDEFKLNEVREMGSTTTIKLTANADPTLLVKVSALLCTLNLIPNRLIVSRQIDDLLCISIERIDATDRNIDLLRRKIMQIPQLIDMVLEPNEASDFQLDTPAGPDENHALDGRP